MILKLLILVLTVYYIWVFWKYYRQDITGLFERTEKYGTEKEPEQPGEPYTVMGRSTYQPFMERNEAGEETDDARNQTGGNESKAGNMEESGTADDGADYSDIEPEEDEEEEYVPTPEEVRELEEEEELGAYYPDGNPDFATGYSFEDLKKVHRVLVSDDADGRLVRCCPR